MRKLIEIQENHFATRHVVFISKVQPIAAAYGFDVELSSGKRLTFCYETLKEAVSNRNYIMDCILEV